MTIKLNRLTRNILKGIAIVALAAFSVYMFPRYDNTFPYHVEPGKPWGYERLTAEFDFPIYKTEAQIAEEREILRRDFAPYFVYIEGAPRTPLVLPLQEMERLRHDGYSRIALVDKHVSTTYQLSDVFTPKTAYEHYQHDVEPNIVQDTATTNQMLSTLMSQVALTQGMVQTGEKIIDRGEIVSESDYQILMSLKRALSDEKVSLKQRSLSTVGGAVLVCLFLLLFVLYLYVFRRSLLEDLSTMLFFCLLPAITVAAACVILRTSLSVFLIPFAWVPIITRVFYDSRTALFLHLTTCLIVSLVVPTPFEFLMIQIAAGMVAVSSLKDMTQRSQLAQTAAWILLTYMVSYTALQLSITGDIHSVDPKMYIVFGANAVLVICAYGLIYLFERTFSLLSAITLVELTDINSPLLQTLAEKAPGTFQHSMQVSNLAAEAAKKVGAKVLLVRTGALYHDIGKLAHPELFTENQYDGENPLSKMDPKEAAQIIISHVTEGVKIAHQHHLPSIIVRFIETHHGRSVARYFYNTYVNQHPDEQVDVAPFQYPGPKPGSREGAIIMMADVIEACSRSLANVTEAAISEMVDRMIDQIVAEGALSETPLSFKDVEDIREVFKARLIAMNHHRIQYPVIKV